MAQRGKDVTQRHGLSMMKELLTHLSGRRDLDSEEPTDPALEEIYSSWALFIFVALLIGTLWCSYFLQLKKIRAIHETVIAIFGGMVVGLIIRVSPGLVIQQMVSFNYTYFFNLLLPPIILNSGYELHQANFFRNFGTILTFAFAGTFIAALIVGLLVYLWTLIGLESLHITFVDAMSVGATLSATDPVTVMAIFKTYKVEPKLQILIFGESLLNDAVAIVMFETLQKFSDKSIHISNIFKGIGIFFLVFGVSLIIGLMVGFITALMLKHSTLSRFPQIESCLILMMAYASYLFSNGCQMSGIVSLLFCGIMLKHYAYHNMSTRTKLTIKYVFSTLARLSENFIFVYLGVSLFTLIDLSYKPLLIVVTTLAICVSRYCSIFPISSLINLVIRHRRGGTGEELSQPHQVMLFWAGLRGAVGVALASGLQGEYAPSLRATILVVVVLTVIVFGGTSARMLEIVGVRTGVDDGDESDEDGDDLYRIVENGSLFSKSTRTESNIPLSSQGYLDQAALKRTRNQTNGKAPDYGDDDFSPRHSLESSNSSGSDLPPRSGISPPRRPLDNGSPSRRDNAASVSGPGGQEKSRLRAIIESTPEDHARWFAHFDENIIKPVLLTDDGRRESSGSPVAGSASPNSRIAK